MNKLEVTVRQRNKDREQRYWDFVINGKPLFDYLKAGNMDLISPFGWTNNKNFEIQILKEFCMEISPILDSGRIMFYVCPECGDIGCGAITGFISENAKGQIEWTNFGYENDYEGIVEKYSNLYFCFDKADYLQEFQRLRESFDQ